jgi:hypothetical protein
MKFYSGFSLKDDKHFFDKFIRESEYSVSGFSYGAIKAFEYVKKQLDDSKRVDTLQLFSPAFFQTKSDKFKRLQLISYGKNKDIYLNQFIKSCFAPYEIKDISYDINSDSNQLKELLEYEWSISQLKYISKKGVKIEVYLGGLDNIIDSDSAKDFFIDVATVTFVKDANHFLQTN